MNELDAIFAWISTTLTGDATLRALPTTGPIKSRWFEGIAPSRDPATRNAMTYPLGIYQFIASRDTRGVGQYRVLTVGLIQAHISFTPEHDVSAAVARMDALLDVPQTGAPRATQVVDGITYTIHGCSRREFVAPIPDVGADGVVYRGRGGIYEVTISR